MCRHYIEIKKAYEAKVRAEKGPSYLESHPFKGAGACGFRIAARKTKAKHGDGSWHLQATPASNLNHNPMCPSVFKVKRGHLLAAPGLREALHEACAGDKMSLGTVKTIALSNGLGDAAAANSVLYRARRDAEREHDKVYAQKWAHLPAFLHEYAQEHTLSQYRIKTADDVPGGEFEAAFCLFGPALEYVRKHGKCSP